MGKAKHDGTLSTWAVYTRLLKEGDPAKEYQKRKYKENATFTSQTTSHLSALPIHSQPPFHDVSSTQEQRKHTQRIIISPLIMPYWYPEIFHF